MECTSLLHLVRVRRLLGEHGGKVVGEYKCLDIVWIQLAIDAFVAGAQETAVDVRGDHSVLDVLGLTQPRSFRAVRRT